VPPDPSAAPSSSWCSATPLAVDVPGAHDCHPDAAHQSLTSFLPLRLTRTRVVEGELDAARGNATRGWGTGPALLLYALDWGDCCPKLRRSRFHVTILKAWPPREDRIYALSTVRYWVSPHDTCDPPMTAFLIRCPTFIGYHWDPKNLRTWLDQVQEDPSATESRSRLPPKTAIPLALAWLARAAKLWALRTPDPFPYSLVDMLPYWTGDESVADLSFPSTDGP